MTLHPLLAALRRHKAGVVLIALQIALTLAIVCNAVFIIGSRARHKNVAMVLDLAQALDERGIDIVVTGGQSSIFAAEEHRAPAPNVRFMGFVDDDDLAALLQGALCLLFPSFTEGFGLPIVEAMALGCPVISSNASSLPEVVGDAGVLVEPDDVEGLSREMLNLLSDEGRWEELRKRGLVRAKQFSWDETARRMVEVYRSVAAQT